MSVLLIKVERTQPDRQEFTLTYRAKHMTPGANGTTLALEFMVGVNGDGAEASVSIETPRMVNEEAAMDKLAEWLDRLAQAIRARRKDDAAITFYGVKREEPSR